MDNQTDLLIEWPLEQGITVSPHHHEEQRQVSTTSRPIPVQIDAQTHLIAIFTCVKCCKTQQVASKSHSIMIVLSRQCSLSPVSGLMYNAVKTSESEGNIFSISLHKSTSSARLRDTTQICRKNLFERIWKNSQQFKYFYHSGLLLLYNAF